MLTPREILLDGAPLTLRLGKGPGNSPAPCSAFSSQSPGGKEEEIEILGKKVRTTGENINTYRPPLPFSPHGQKQEAKWWKKIYDQEQK